MTFTIGLAIGFLVGFVTSACILHLVLKRLVDMVVERLENAWSDK